MRRENRNAPDSSDLSPTIPDDRGYLRFRVFISRQNLGRSGNSKIPDRLGFSRHIKTRLYEDVFLFSTPTGNSNNKIIQKFSVVNNEVHGNRKKN